jgi:hypothetical protein
MGIGATKVCTSSCNALVCTTRWTVDTWEVNTLGKYSADLSSTLFTLGYEKPEAYGPGAMVAEYHDTMGCDWSTALAACNCD